VVAEDLGPNFLWVKPILKIQIGLSLLKVENDQFASYIENTTGQKERIDKEK